MWPVYLHFSFPVIAPYHSCISKKRFCPLIDLHSLFDLFKWKQWRTFLDYLLVWKRFKYFWITFYKWIIVDWLINWMTAWLITNYVSDCLSVCLNDWMTDWRYDWRTEWVTEWLTKWIRHLRNDWLTHWLTWWLMHLITGCHSDWLIVRLVRWLVDRKTGRQYSRLLQIYPRVL